MNVWQLVLLIFSFIGGLILLLHAYRSDKKTVLRFDTSTNVKIRIAVEYGLSAGLLVFSMVLFAGSFNKVLAGYQVPALFFTITFIIVALGSMYNLFISRDIWKGLIEKTTRFSKKHTNNIGMTQVYKATTSSRLMGTYFLGMGAVGAFLIQKFFLDFIKIFFTQVTNDSLRNLVLFLKHSFLIIILLGIEIMIISMVINLFFCKLHVSSVGITYSRWPFRTISGRWEDLERNQTEMHESLYSSTLLLRRAKPGFQLKMGEYSLGSRDYDIIPLSSFEGWTDGTIVEHIRRFRPDLIPD